MAVTSSLEREFRYRCCCGCMSVKTGAFIIAVIEICYSFMYMVSSIIQITYDKRQIAPIAISIIFGIIIIATAAAMIFGLDRNNPFMIIPHLIVQFLLILLYIAVFIVGCVYIAYGEKSNNEVDYLFYSANGSQAFVIGIVMLVFELWFFAVCFKAYRLVKEISSGRITLHLSGLQSGAGGAPAGSYGAV